MKDSHIANALSAPSLAEENFLNTKGYQLIAGLDEAGRGALAGPVVAAAVILPRADTFPNLKKVRDSKEISPALRESLFDVIQDESIATGAGIVPSQTIDIIGILNATKVAMRLAIKQLTVAPDFLLVDAVTIPRIRIKQKGIIKGDKLCLSIACASIIAKVTRDRIMREMDECYPGYELALHKGYGTKRHLSCLRENGPSVIHRTSFAPVREMAGL